jgi:N-acetyl sugar amidotransferase
MDTTVPEIHFDAAGVCQYCHIHDLLERQYPSEPSIRERQLNQLVDAIRRDGRGKPYDCVMGVSGGRDSTYGLYLAVKLGLRPLAVHFDNGWNTPIAVGNIKRLLETVRVDLDTVVADWEEFRDLQCSFLKASVPDVDIPTDVAIHSVLHRAAAREGIKYVFFCHSFRTEGITPRGWSFLDGRYIRDVQKRFGKLPLKDYRNFTLFDFAKYSYLSGIKSKTLVNYFDYDQKKVSEMLTREVGWKYYGGHHHESTYTAFIQSYLLPRKFNIDKRKTELSALIRSGQRTRDEAISEVDGHPYEFDEKVIPYILNKLEISPPEWERIFRAPPKTHLDYRTYYPFMRAMKLPLRAMVDLGLLSDLIYVKYLG